MERTISQEERIRRAEEIYSRRKQASGVRVSTNNVNRVEKNNFSLFKKMLMQLAICAVIYIIFYLIKNTNYIFSEDFVKKTREFLSYDINFGEIQAQVTEFWNNNKNIFGIGGEEQSEDENIVANEFVNDIVNGITAESANEILSDREGEISRR